MVEVLHPWNHDPLTRKPSRYRLTVRQPDLTADAPDMATLLDLNQQLNALGHDFVKLEKVTDA